MLASMREHLQVEAEEEIIALNELLCFLLLAVARKAEWKGELVLIVRNYGQSECKVLAPEAPTSSSDGTPTHPSPAAVRSRV